MRRTALFSAVVIGCVMIGFVAVLATRRSAVDQQSRSPLLGKPAPALSSSQFDLTSLRGKYVLVNFFASWCVPCQQEQPQLVRFAHEANRAVVGVLYEDTPSSASSYLSKNGGDWPVVEDADYQHAVDWGVRGPPESYLLNPDGIVLAKFIGQVTAARLDDIVGKASAA